MTLPKGKALRVAFGETVAELGETDPRIVVLDGDLGSSTRADIFEAAHPDRFFQMGIAEQNLLGVAAGMATVGFIPFVSTFACFAVARALDSIRVLIAQPKLNVKITGGYAGLLAGMTGKTHLMFDDVAVMRAMANMVVVAPADEVETRQAIASIVEYDGPVYLRLTRPDTPILFDDSYRFELGNATVVREGNDVTVFSSGVQTTRVFEAAEQLAAEGIDVHLVHVPTIKPLDTDGIVAAARKTGFVITSEEHTIIGGLGGAIAETLSEHHPVPVKRIGLADTFGESGPNDALLEKYGISVDKTAANIRRLVGEARGKDAP
jgi:transketolase